MGITPNANGNGSVYTAYNPVLAALGTIKLPQNLDPTKFVENVNLKNADEATTEKYASLLLELNGHIDRGAVNTNTEKITIKDGDEKTLEYRKRTAIKGRIFDKVRVFKYKEVEGERVLLSISHYYYINGKLRTQPFTYNDELIDKPSKTINYSGHEALEGSGESGEGSGTGTTNVGAGAGTGTGAGGASTEVGIAPAGAGTGTPSGTGGTSGAQPGTGSVAQPGGTGAGGTGTSTTGAQPGTGAGTGSNSGSTTTGETEASDDAGRTDGAAPAATSARVFPIKELKIKLTGNQAGYKPGDKIEAEIEITSDQEIVEGELEIKMDLGESASKKVYVSGAGIAADKKSAKQKIFITVPKTGMEQGTNQLLVKVGDKKKVLDVNVLDAADEAAGTGGPGKTDNAPVSKNITATKVMFIDKDGIEIKKPKFKPGSPVKVKVEIKEKAPVDITVGVSIDGADEDRKGYIATGVILKDATSCEIEFNLPDADELEDGSSIYLKAEVNIADQPKIKKRKYADGTEEEYEVKERGWNEGVVLDDNIRKVQFKVDGKAGDMKTTTASQMALGDYNTETGSWSPSYKDFTMPNLGANGTSNYGGYWTTTGFDASKQEKYPVKGLYYHTNPLFDISYMNKEYNCNDVLRHALDEVLPNQAGFNGLTVDKGSCNEIIPMDTQTSGSTTQQNGDWAVMCRDKQGNKYKVRIHADTKTIAGLGTPQAHLTMQIVRVADDKGKPIDNAVVENSFADLREARKKIAEVPPPKKEEKKEK